MSNRLVNPISSISGLTMTDHLAKNHGLWLKFVNWKSMSATRVFFGASCIFTQGKLFQGRLLRDVSTSSWIWLSLEPICLSTLEVHWSLIGSSIEGDHIPTTALKDIANTLHRWPAEISLQLRTITGIQIIQWKISKNIFGRFDWCLIKQQYLPG